MTLPGAKNWSRYQRDVFMKGQLLVQDASGGFSGIRNEFSTALIVLMCMVGLVLLIACANVANLLIARAFMRQKELAVRLSLGASRGRLVGQMLVESLVLAVLGAIVGLALSVVLTRTMIALIPVGTAPLLITATPDLRILGFTLVLTVVTALVFGLLPAFRASRPDPWTTLKDTIRSIAERTWVVVPPQGAGDAASGAQLPIALRRRVVRAQPAQPEVHRHRSCARQPRDLPTVTIPAATTASARRCSTTPCSNGCVPRRA